jgi:hypothetical protein
VVSSHRCASIQRRGQAVVGGVDRRRRLLEKLENAAIGTADNRWRILRMNGKGSCRKRGIWRGSSLLFEA